MARAWALARKWRERVATAHGNKVWRVGVRTGAGDGTDRAKGVARRLADETADELGLIINLR